MKKLARRLGIVVVCIYLLTLDGIGNGVVSIAVAVAFAWVLFRAWPALVLDVERVRHALPSWAGVRSRSARGDHL